MTSSSLLVERLRDPGPLVSVELRPPRTELDRDAGMEAWIDLHHTLRRLLREDLFVFLTDNAVGLAEEENLAHIGANVGDDVDRRRIVPILTSKHSLEYCLMFASRASAQGYDALTVLGGDRGVGPPRCVAHGKELRKLMRDRVPSLALGGWTNPLKNLEEQIGYMAESDAQVDFALTQIVSHHSLGQVEAFMEGLDRAGLRIPVVFGVFYYRSANPGTLAELGRFFPVPAEAITRDFAQGAGADELCAKSISELRRVGADKVYVSNLPNRGGGARLRRILERV